MACASVSGLPFTPNQQIMHFWCAPIVALCGLSVQRTLVVRKLYVCASKTLKKLLLFLCFESCKTGPVAKAQIDEDSQRGSKESNVFLPSYLYKCKHSYKRGGSLSQRIYVIVSCCCRRARVTFLRLFAANVSAQYQSLHRLTSTF